MNFIAALKLALSLLPIIHDAVAQVETLFPEGGNGAKKLEMVKGIIENVLSVSNTAGASMAFIWPVVSGMVSSIVALKKAASGSAPAAPVAQVAQVAQVAPVISPVFGNDA